MTTVDYVLLAVVGLSALVGLLRGLVKEALSLAVWIGAAWAALRFGEVGAGVLAGFIGAGEIRLWAGRLLVFIVLVFAGSLLTWLVGYLVRNSAVTGADRALGLAFGVGRGVLVAGLLALALQVGGFPAEPWWQQSKLIPYAAAVGQVLRDLAGDPRAAAPGAPPGPGGAVAAGASESRG